MFIRLFAYSFSSIVWGQQGLIINNDHYDEQPVLKTTDGAKSSLKKLEEVHVFSLKEYCPTPSDQGMSAACVGWATTYGAQTIRMAFTREIKNRDVIDQKAFSPHFIYNQVKLKDCELGSEIPDALILMMTAGNLPLRSFEEGANDCFIRPQSHHFLSAYPNRVKDFRKIFSPEDARLEKINSVKFALIEGFPVIVAMEITQSFFALEKGEKTWYSEIGSQNSLGGHALVIIGYDEIENAFEVMNSWGTDWANDGFAWVRYEDFVRYAKYGFTFYEGQSDLMSILINFKRKSLITRDNQIIFTDELFSRRNTIYEAVNTVASINSDYKIEILHSTREYYLYCLNKSGSGNYTLLFSIDQEVFDLFGKTSMYGITLPDDRYASIRLTDSSSEHFLFIISKSRLSQELISELSQSVELSKISELLRKKYKVNDSLRTSYNKVGFISRLGKNDVVLLPVHFNYQKKK